MDEVAWEAVSSETGRFAVDKGNQCHVCIHKILCLQRPGIQEICNHGERSSEASYKGAGENFLVSYLFITRFLFLTPDKLPVGLFL